VQATHTLSVWQRLRIKPTDGKGAESQSRIAACDAACHADNVWISPSM
jgi:hypothetical protein